MITHNTPRALKQNWRTRARRGKRGQMLVHMLTVRANTKPEITLKWPAPPPPIARSPRTLGLRPLTCATTQGECTQTLARTTSLLQAGMQHNYTNKGPKRPTHRKGTNDLQDEEQFDNRPLPDQNQWAKAPRLHQGDDHPPCKLKSRSCHPPPPAPHQPTPHRTLHRNRGANKTAEETACDTMCAQIQRRHVCKHPQHAGDKRNAHNISNTQHT